MSTATHQIIHHVHPGEEAKSSLFATFIRWCDEQQDDHLLWLCIALAGHGCALTPLTLVVLLTTGFNFGLIILAFTAMAAAVISNLGNMPTRYTIPVLLLSVLIDLGIIIGCLIKFLSTY